MNRMTCEIFSLAPIGGPRNAKRSSLMGKLTSGGLGKPLGWGEGAIRLAARFIGRAGVRGTAINTITRTCAVISFFLLVAGCNFAPHYHVPPSDTPAAYKETNGWKIAQPADNKIKGNWWEIFNDPELNRLEVQVGVSNQNVVAALENFLAARAVARQAWSSFFPTVTFAPSANKSSGLRNTTATVAVGNSNNVTGSSSSSTSYTLPLDASWEPDLWGSIRNTVRASTYAAQASAAQVENLRLTAQAELAADYFQLRAQDQLIRVFNSTATNYEQSLELTKTLAGTGIQSELDVAQADTILQTTLAQATGLGISRAQLEHAIAMLIGRPASEFSLEPSTNQLIIPSVPVGLPSQLLERRPDIAAAERAVAQANASIGVARAAYFPTLNLTGGAGFESTTLGALLNASSFYWSIGASLAETVFDAGRRRAASQQAWATYNANVASYRQTTLTAFQQVEDNLSGLRLLSMQIEQQNKAVQAAQKSLDLAVDRYRLGINSYLNVITAELTLLSNEQTAVTLRSQQMTDTVQLIMALGGGWNANDLPAPARVLHGSTNGLAQAVNPPTHTSSQ
jgi:NodT family efflux transporter outer membrane factor (OMF) lipoprotein